MMKNLIRLMALVLSLTMVMALFAACGKKDDGSGEETANVQLDGSQKKWASMFGEEYVTERAAYEKENSPYDVPEELKGTTVKFATWIDHTTTEASYALSNFEKVTGIKVEWVEIPQGTYLEKLASLVASGDAPDVYVENNNFFPKTLTISKPLNEIKSIDMEDPIWDKGYFNFSTFNGKTYQCNTRNSVWQTVNLLFYNKKVFEENGLKTPDDYIAEDNWTLDSLTEMLREFCDLDGNNSGGAMPTSFLAKAFGTDIVYMKDGKFVSGLNDKNFNTVYSKTLEMIDDGLIGGSAAAFMKGTNAIYATDSYGLKKSGYFKGSDPEIYGYAPIPTNADVDSKVSSHYRAYGVLSGAKNPEGAGYFLRYFLDPYNYNWNDIFLDESAMEFYLENCADVDFEKKQFGFNTCMTTLMGYTGYEGSYKWENALNRAQVSQWQTVASSITNEVNTAIGKANDILAKLQ